MGHGSPQNTVHTECRRSWRLIGSHTKASCGSYGSGIFHVSSRNSLLMRSLLQSPQPCQKRLRNGRRLYTPSLFTSGLNVRDRFHSSFSSRNAAGRSLLRNWCLVAVLPNGSLFWVKKNNMNQGLDSHIPLPRALGLPRDTCCPVEYISPSPYA